MKNFTAKNIQLWIKSSFSLMDVVKLVEATDEDELKRVIRKKFTRKAESYIRSLQSNKGSKLKTRKYDSSIAFSGIATSEKRDDNASKSTDANMITLKMLKGKIEERQQIITKLEADSSKLLLEYKRLIKNAIMYYGSLEEIRNQISQIISKLIECDRLATQTAELHENVIQKLDEERRKLSELENELEERSLIQILVYSDGSFTGEQDGRNYTLSCEGWEKHLARLKEDKNYEMLCELRLKEISQLAKLLAIVNNIRDNYTVTFDSAEMERIFNIFTSYNR